ncbi:putative purine nucleoside permease [Fusarium globosum]|uniref:Putative purine nucleoside permease n=1 Tax=Fusarium globosum TaxID=78864 RepID=A0A8H5Z2H1_9HYPO|nr:putative purine nucleoside permease [Fusarium globosum]
MSQNENTGHTAPVQQIGDKNEQTSEADVLAMIERIRNRSGEDIAADSERLAAEAKRFYEEQMRIRSQKQREQMVYIAKLALAVAFIVGAQQPGGAKISPKVLLIAMFYEESRNWLAPESALQFSRKVRVPGLARGYEDIHVTENGEVGLLVVGTALINASLSISALLTSPLFDLTKSYFVLTGIAGVNPKRATIGSVAFAKFAIQVDTQLEFDAREVTEEWGSGFVPMGADRPDQFPGIVHGSEVFELNANLRDYALSVARTVALTDSPKAAEHRALWKNSTGGVFDAAAQDPTVLEGDVLSSNTFWHGHRISEAMEKVAKVYTSGQGEYTMTAQEDNALLAGLLNAALQGKVDFSRILLIRSASNFDRGHEDKPHQLPFVMDKGGLGPSTRNLYLTALKVIEGILEEWSNRFEAGIPAQNYIGDIFGSLGGTPGFGDKQNVEQIRSH